MLEGLDTKVYKESGARLSRFVPWAFMADCEGVSGVVIQKGGCMQKSSGLLTCGRN